MKGKRKKSSKFINNNRTEVGEMMKIKRAISAFYPIHCLVGHESFDKKFLDHCLKYEVDPKQFIFVFTQFYEEFERIKKLKPGKHMISVKMLPREKV